MNRLLQHFVDSGTTPSAPANRPPIPAPPQSSGGSYNAGSRGSYQRSSPGGPFYYQPPPQPNYQQRNGPFGTSPQLSEGHNAPHGLEEIPLSSQSTGALYETVDLNADSTQQHRPHQQHQQRLFTPPSRPPSTPNSQGHNYTTPLYKAATPPVSGSGDGPQHSRPPPFYQHQSTGSTGSASELFANGPPPAASSLFSGPPSGSGGNPYRRQAPANHFAAPPVHGNAGMTRSNTSPPKDPFAASPSGNSEIFGRAAPTNDPFAAPRSGSSSHSFGHSTGPTGGDPFADHAPKANDLGARQNEPGNHVQQTETTADPFASTPVNAGGSPFSANSNASPFGSTPANAGSSPFASSSPVNPGRSPFESPALSNGGMSSADSLFSSPAPANNADWSKPPQPSQPSPTKADANDLFSHAAPTANELFGSNAYQPAVNPSPTKPPVPSSPQINSSPSPPKYAAHAFSSPVMAPQAGIPPPSPVKPHARVPPSPVKTEGHVTASLGSMRLSTPAKSPLKSGLDVRHVFNAKIPIGKRDDDAVSLAPSLAPSRMSMLSTLDDSLKLSDMYKQMTARLEGEKNDLLKVVASQADEIAQMKKQIKSLEQQLKKYRAKDA